MYNLRRLQLEQLTILDELKRICEKHKLTFYLAYGSCLGALRHGGFIPWDDDIDVLMPVEDYDKLIKLTNEVGNDFFLQTYLTDPGFTAAIARLRKNNTVCIEEDEKNKKCHHGIFIDIYPQYQYPDYLIDRIHIIFASVFYRILLMRTPPAHHGIGIKLFGTLALFFLSFGGIENNTKKYHAILRKYHGTKYVADLYGMDLSLTKVLKYRQEWFQEPKWIHFEGRNMPIPTNVDAFMRERYGENYMELPSEDKRTSYHHYVYVSFGN